MFGIPTAVYLFSKNFEIRKMRMRQTRVVEIDVKILNEFEL